MSRNLRESKLAIILALLGLALLSILLIFLLKDMEKPLVGISIKAEKAIGPRNEINLNLTDTSGIESIVAYVRRGEQSVDLLTKEFSQQNSTTTYSFTLENAQLPDGPFTLILEVTDASFMLFGKGNTTTLEIPLIMDTQPPRILVKTVTPGIRRGGSALIKYTLSEDVASTGVFVDDLFFPAYKQENGAYICLFPFPYSMTTSTYLPQIMAEDFGGNVTKSRLLVNRLNKTYKTDTLYVSDNFLEAKAQELIAMCPDSGTLLDQYICANTTIREENKDFLFDIGRKSTNEFSWSGNFIRLPRAATMADFGENRTYKYKSVVNDSNDTNTTIDKQTHLGVDLASVAEAPIPVASDGIVTYTGVLGIYGNIVTIDHGIGLTTIYSHLTDINVAVGDNVKQGDTLGTTGKTGLAGGDHVHFGVLVGGFPVNPMEWLDDKWLQNNIKSRLNTPI